MSDRMFRFYLMLARKILPKGLVYACGIQIWSQATTGAYSAINPSKIPFYEAVNRYARFHAIPGHGEDKCYNSNRRVKRC